MMRNTHRANVLGSVPACINRVLLSSSPSSVNNICKNKVASNEHSQDYESLCNSFTKALHRHRSCANNSIMIKNINVSDISKAKNMLLGTLQSGDIGHDVKEAVLYCNADERVTSGLVEFKDFSTIAKSGVLKKLFKAGKVDYGTDKGRLFSWRHRHTVSTDNTCDAPVDIVRTETRSLHSVMKDLQICGSISEQILSMYDAARLTDGGVRQRFSVCQLLEDAQLLNTDKLIEIYPFGSSVSSVGKCDSDLDVVLTQLDRLSRESKYYGDRMELESDTEQIAVNLDQLGGVIVKHVFTRARVPIVKFCHVPTKLECDINVSEESALAMGELIYVMCEWQPLARALIVIVHLWARHVGLITNVLGAHFMKNLIFTMMIIFYLQQRNLLPSYNSLLANSRNKPKKSRAVTELNRISPPSSLDASQLQYFLHEFFLYYLQFNYRHTGIDVGHGSLLRKEVDRGDKLLIVNPLLTDPDNIAYNVSRQQVKRLIDAMEVALWKLEYYDQRQEDRPWGIMALFDEPMLNVKKIIS